jgi:hypothetical protein
MSFNSEHQQNRKSGLVYGRSAARQAAFKSKQTTSSSVVETLQKWGKPAAVCSLFYVLLVIGIHGWIVGFLPRFSQTEILSDVLWVFFVGLLSGALACSLVFLMPFLFVSIFSISENERSHKSHSDRVGNEGRRILLTPWQLRLIGFLLFGAIPLYVISTSVIIDVDVRQRFLGIVLPIYLLMSLVTMLSKRDVVKVNSLGLPLSMLLPKDENGWGLPAGKWSEYLRLVWAELVKAFFFALLLGIISFTGILVLGKIGGGFFLAVGLLWPSVGFLLIVVVTVANSANLVWMYSGDRGWLPTVQIVSGAAISMIMIFAIPLVIYFSRIGNLSNATIVFDPKFSNIVAQLSTVAQSGDTVATAKVDVVLAFGADVVLAASGNFQTNSACEFTWFQQSNMGSGSNRKNVDKVKCIVLPRNAVFSIL